MVERNGYAAGTPSWVDLGTSDTETSTRFYHALFGWEFEDQAPDGGGYAMCTLRGKVVAGLGPQMDASQPPRWTTYITVDDADAAAASIDAAGGKILLPTMDILDVGRMALFTDPAGAAFAVWQPRLHHGAQLVNEPGTLCWNELTSRDVEGVKTFYGSVFGWEAQAVEGMDDYVIFMLGTNAVAGALVMNEQWPADAPQHWVVYFAVDDCDARAAQAQELGATVTVPPSDLPGVGRIAVLNGPQGEQFSIIQLPQS
jgi:predicted enzyme related to lactoylglutathione lyase